MPRAEPDHPAVVASFRIPDMAPGPHHHKLAPPGAVSGKSGDRQNSGSPPEPRSLRLRPAEAPATPTAGGSRPPSRALCGGSWADVKAFLTGFILLYVACVATSLLLERTPTYQERAWVLAPRPSDLPEATPEGGSLTIASLDIRGTRYSRAPAPDSGPASFSVPHPSAAPEASTSGPPADDVLPPDFDWQSYLRWNADVADAGYANRAAAEAHFRLTGHAEKRLYKPAKIAFRYTACGGVFNQHYCHLSTLALAVLAGAEEVYWPAALERASFVDGESPWSAADPNALWNFAAIEQALQARYILTLIPPPAGAALPDLSSPQTAFQTWNVSTPYDLALKFDKLTYIKHVEPQALLRDVHAAIRDAYDQAGAQRHPRSVLVDLPCTLFFLETRKLPLVEDLARLLAWSPTVHALADKVVAAITAQGEQEFNGVHLRVEKDSMPWQVNTGGVDQYWERYKLGMRRAAFDQAPRALYVASSLLEADAESKQLLDKLSRELVELQFTTGVVHKRMFLSDAERSGLLREQLALVDFLVLRQAASVLGVGMSTFSFYLQETRLMDGFDPRNTTLLFMPTVGTDELFFSAAVAAIKTRASLRAQSRLHETCQRATLEPCFTR